MNAKRAARASFVGAICLLLIACGTPDVAPTEGVANASPEVATPVEPTPAASATVGTPDESFPDGLVLTMSVTVDTTFRPEESVRAGDLFVIGRVVEALPARWTTPDGRRPSDLLADVPHPYIIVTPYVLEFEVPDYLRSLTGPIIPLNDRGANALPADATRIVVVVIGGTVEKDSVVNGSPWGLLTVGDRILVRLTETQAGKADVPSEQLVPTTAGPGWWEQMYFVLDDDGSATFYDQPQPAVEVVTEILDALTRVNVKTATP